MKTLRDVLYIPVAILGFVVFILLYGLIFELLIYLIPVSLVIGAVEWLRGERQVDWRYPIAVTYFIVVTFAVCIGGPSRFPEILGAAVGIPLVLLIVAHHAQEALRERRERLNREHDERWDSDP